MHRPLLRVNVKKLSFGLLSQDGEGCFPRTPACHCQALLMSVLSALCWLYPWNSDSPGCLDVPFEWNLDGYFQTLCLETLVFLFRNFSCTLFLFSLLSCLFSMKFLGILMLEGHRTFGFLFQTPTLSSMCSVSLLIFIQTVFFVVLLTLSLALIGGSFLTFVHSSFCCSFMCLSPNVM